MRSLLSATTSLPLQCTGIAVGLAQSCIIVVEHATNYNASECAQHVADGRSRSRKVHARNCRGRGTSCMPAFWIRGSTDLRRFERILGGSGSIRASVDSFYPYLFIQCRNWELSKISVKCRDVFRSYRCRSTDAAACQTSFRKTLHAKVKEKIAITRFPVRWNHQAKRRKCPPKEQPKETISLNSIIMFSSGQQCWMLTVLRRYGFIRFKDMAQENTVKLQIFVRYLFSYFRLETGSYILNIIFVLSRVCEENDIEIQWLQSKKKFSYDIKFCTFSKVRNVRKFVTVQWSIQHGALKKSQKILDMAVQQSGSWRIRQFVSVRLIFVHFQCGSVRERHNAKLVENQFCRLLRAATCFGQDVA